MTRGKKMLEGIKELERRDLKKRKESKMKNGERGGRK